MKVQKNASMRNLLIFSIFLSISVLFRGSAQSAECDSIIFPLKITRNTSKDVKTGYSNINEVYKYYAELKKGIDTIYEDMENAKPDMVFLYVRELLFILEGEYREFFPFDDNAYENTKNTDGFYRWFVKKAREYKNALIGGVQVIVGNLTGKTFLELSTKYLQAEKSISALKIDNAKAKTIEGVLNALHCMISNEYIKTKMAVEEKLEYGVEIETIEAFTPLLYMEEISVNVPPIQEQEPVQEQPPVDEIVELETDISEDKETLDTGYSDYVLKVSEQTMHFGLFSFQLKKEEATGNKFFVEVTQKGTQKKAVSKMFSLPSNLEAINKLKPNVQDGRLLLQIKLENLGYILTLTFEEKMDTLEALPVYEIAIEKVNLENLLL